MLALQTTVEDRSRCSVMNARLGIAIATEAALQERLRAAEGAQLDWEVSYFSLLNDHLKVPGVIRWIFQRVR